MWRTTTDSVTELGCCANKTGLRTDDKWGSEGMSAVGSGIRHWALKPFSSQWQRIKMHTSIASKLQVSIDIGTHTMITDYLCLLKQLRS